MNRSSALPMKNLSRCLFVLAFLAPFAVSAQPAFVAPPPPRTVVQEAGQRRDQYLQRVNEVLTWRADQVKRDDLAGTMDMAAIATMRSFRYRSPSPGEM